MRSILQRSAKANALLDEVMQIERIASITREEIERIASIKREEVFHVASDSSQAGAASGSRDTIEPKVEYTYESWQCRVPPGEVVLYPEKMKGRLLWGGLSHVLNKAWLRWKGVTHVLNCLGAKSRHDGDIVPDPHFTLAVNARAFDDGIDYFDWCINHQACRTNYLLMFSKLAIILSTRGTCLYVHCKSGRDRSVMTVFALLRLQFSQTHEVACKVVNSRIGVDKWPCANLEDKGAILKWIDFNLSS